MKLKVTSAGGYKGLTVTASLTPDEFLQEARLRFPNPSEFMREFLNRYEEALIERDSAEHVVHEVEEHSQDEQCPACGHMFVIETQTVDRE